MTYSIKSKVWAIVVTLAMLLSMLPVVPLHVHAAGTLTVTDANVGLSWTDASSSKGSASWSANGSTVTGTATGYTQYVVSKKSVTTTLTITNNYSDDRTLSFDYALTGGGGSVSGTISGTSGSYSAPLVAGASTTITLTSPTGSGNTNTLTLSNLQLLASGNVTSTFLPGENGSYTVDGTAVTAQTTKEKAATEAYTLNATPASGYMFFGWWSNASNSYVSYDNPASVKFGSDPQLKPVFLSADTALFGVGAKTFADLTEAANYALTATTKTVVLLNNGTLRGEHTIPAGVTLLIPFDDSNTLYTNKPACTSSLAKNVAWVKPTAYRTLAMAADAKITVNGAMSLSAKHAAANGGSNYCGSPTGPVSFVTMQEGANITVNNGGKLYAWGFITGSGSVTANSGATVYENFQITDFRGGSATTAYADTGLAFPLNQYYVQNIEVPVTFYAGASEIIYTSAYSSGMCLSGEATFIGNGGMFTSSEGGYVIKDFDESRDRLNVDLYGSCELNSMKVNLSIEVDSANFLLPITNNVSISIHSGTTTLKQSVALLPGVEVTVDQGATLNLAHSGTSINDYCADGYNIIVYDRDEWFYGLSLDEATIGEKVTDVKYGLVLHSNASVPNGYTAKPSYFAPVLYAPGRTGGRTDADLKDAVLNINGTLVANGFIYTTIGGASIISSEKTGKIEMLGGAGDDVITFQNNGTTKVTLGLMIRSAWLQNGDDTYLQTKVFDDETGDVISAAEAGTIYDYCATHDCWYTDECAKCNAGFTITWIVDEIEYTSTVEPNAVPEVPEEVQALLNKTGHAVAWDKVIGAATEDTTYTAVFTPIEYTVTWVDGNGDEIYNEEVAYGDLPSYKEDTPTKTPTAQYTYTFDGWDNEIVAVTGDVTYTATFTTTTNQYLITWNDTDSNTLYSEDVEYGTIPKFDANKIVSDYEKPDCGTASVVSNVVSVTGDATYEVNWTINHVDYPNDHLCDVCGTELSQCADSDNDHKCDVCGAQMDCCGDYLTLTKGKDATCGADGWKGYYSCSCGKIYADATAETEITDLDAWMKGAGKIDATGNHVYVPGEYIWAEDFSSCTVTGTCACSTTATAKAEISTEVLTPAHCEAPANMKFTATFEETWAETQTKEDYDPSGKLDSTNHMAGNRYQSNGNDTHTQLCLRCGVPIAEPEAHNKGSVVTSGNCLYEETYNCSKCATVWAGEKKPDVHAAGDTIYYKDTEGDTHTAYHPCCNAVIDTISHDYTFDTTNHKCVCGAVETFTVTINLNGGVVSEEGKEQAEAAGSTVTNTQLISAPLPYNKSFTLNLGGMVTREGYTVTGFKTEDGTLYSETDSFDVTSDLEVTIQWECLHTIEENLTYTDLGNGTHKVTCSCGEDWTEWHSDEGICACGVVYVRVYFVMAQPVGVDLGLDPDADYDAIWYGFFVHKDEDLRVEIEPLGDWQYVGYDIWDEAQDNYWETAEYKENATELVVSKDWYDAEELWIRVYAHSYETIDLNGGALSEEAEEYSAEVYDPEKNTITWCAPAGSSWWLNFYTEVFVREGYTLTGATCSNGTTYGLEDWIEAVPENVTFTLTWQCNHEGDKTYTNLGDGNHKISCATCNETLTETEAHTYDETTHKCACDKVEEFTLTYFYAGTVKEHTVEYGAALPAFATDPIVGDRGTDTFLFWIDRSNYTEFKDTTMPARDLKLEAQVSYTGWVDAYMGAGTAFMVKNSEQTGWICVNDKNELVTDGSGDWYYADPETYCVVTEISRVPYPKFGDYGPDDRDIDEEDYPDADSALFVFGEDGKFLSDLNGLTSDNHWAVNGMLPWFVGLVEADGEYYYFGANNTMVTPSHRTGGKIYLSRDSRNNIPENDLFVAKGIYFFGADGKLIKNDGVTEMDGKLYYFDNYRLALGAGLVKENGNFYYVRSTGELVVNKSYWIYNVNEYTEISVGTYTFDEFGVMDVNSNKNGIYAENGGLFYYENGKLAYKGLMEYNGGYIYVRSNGQLATGKYWITKTNDIAGFTESTYCFGDDGMMLNGVVEGFYYENGKLAYKGLMEYDGGYIYVRSNGQLATGKYWVTKTNELVPVGTYDFGTDGKMIIDELPAYHDGVVNGYYYVEGVLQKGAGPIIWENNIYYVRSNGQVATGVYWTTAENDILPSGRYTFDETGKLITE